MNNPFKISVLAYGKLLDIIQKQIPDDPECEVSIVPCTIEQVPSCVDNEIRNGTEVFIAGSANAIEISKISKVPVSRVVVSDFDYLCAVIEAFKIGKEPLLVDYKSPRANISKISEMLGVEVNHLCFEDESSLHIALQNTSADVIVGASTACFHANALGLKSILIYGEDTVLRAFSQAKRMASSLRTAQHTDAVTQAIISNTPVGLIVSNEADKILYINNRAKEYAGVSNLSMGNISLSELAPSLSTDKRLRNTAHRGKSYKILNGTRFWVEQTRIVVKNEPIGTLTVLTIDNQQKKEASSARDLSPNWDMLVCHSQAAQQMRNDAQKCTQSALPLTLFGDYGTDTNLLASCIHSNGPRSTNPLVRINLAGISENDAGRFLLGTDDPASPYCGLLESANHGTVILENLAQANESVQACLVSVLINNRLIHSGSTIAKPIDIRFITLMDGLHDRPAKVRPDLFTYLNTLSIHVPSLEQRREDIPDLFYNTLRNTIFHTKLPEKSVLTECLQAYHWPGNFPELASVASRFSQALTDYSSLSQNAVRRILIESIGEKNLLNSILIHYPPVSNWGKTDPKQIKELVSKVKRVLHYNNDQLCEHLGISRTSLWRITSQEK